MKDFEKILELADFSRETTQKNQLYYELFRKPIPVNESVSSPLGDLDLSFVNGGVRSMPAAPGEAEGIIVRMDVQGAVVRDIAGQEQLITEDMVPGVKNMRPGDHIRFLRQNALNDY